jgi:hypothetical protein
MIEIAALAASIVTSFLIPLVKDTATGLREKLAKTAGDSTADGLVKTAETLWDKVKGSANTEDEQALLGTFERQPDLLKEAVEKIVRSQLENDPKFREEATNLLEADAGNGKTTWQLMGDIVGVVDARWATISGGQVAGVVYGVGGTERGGSGKINGPTPQ